MANADPPAERASGEALSFEAALEQLEAIVDRLERGELALEDALATFEDGVGALAPLRRAARRRRAPHRSAACAKAPSCVTRPLDGREAE